MALPRRFFSTFLILSTPPKYQLDLLLNDIQIWRYKSNDKRADYSNNKQDQHVGQQRICQSCKNKKPVTCNIDILGQTAGNSIIALKTKSVIANANTIQVKNANISTAFNNASSEKCKMKVYFANNDASPLSISSHFDGNDLNTRCECE